MLLQRVWGRLRNVRKLGMLGATLASCGLALATVVPTAYALACGGQNHHKTTQISSSHNNVVQVAQSSGSHNELQIAQSSGSSAHESPTVLYVYKCSCKKDHRSPSATQHNSDSHGSNSDTKDTENHHNSTSGDTNTRIADNSNANGKSGQPASSGGGSNTTPGLPFTGSSPD
jgi:hypothetical protein